MCPTCGHTVQRVNEGVGPKTWWCPRCGTLKTDSAPDFEQPRFLKSAVSNLQHVDDTPQEPREDPGPVCGVLWSKVAYVFGIGSTSATALCRAVGLDPDHRT